MLPRRNWRRARQYLLRIHRCPSYRTVVDFEPTLKFTRLLSFLDQVRQMASSAIVAVEVHRHKHTWTAEFIWAFTTQAGHLVIRINLVELQNSKLHLFALVLLFF